MRCPQSHGQAEGNPELGAIVLVLLLAGVAVLRHRTRRTRAWRVSANHPLLLEARRKAVATLAMLRQLHADHPSSSQIRWASAPNYTIAEWQWLDVIDLGPEYCIVAVPALPDDAAANTPTPLPVNIQDIIDWRVRLPDGSVRGGFTTQAEIRLAKQLGVPFPDESNRHADGKFTGS